MRNRGWLPSVLVGLTLAATVTHAAAAEIQLTACVGDTSRCFDAFTVDLGIVNSGGLIVGSGSPASAPTFNRVAITKAPDGFTPELASFAAQSTLLPAASIDFTDVTGPTGGNLVLTVALDNVLVTKFTVGVAEDGTPVELVELDYQQITFTGGQATFCWDRVLRRRCS
jgi:hypothetical protein